MKRPPRLPRGCHEVTSGWMSINHTCELPLHCTRIQLITLQKLQRCGIRFIISKRDNKFSERTEGILHLYTDSQISNCTSKYLNVFGASVAHVSYDLAVRHRPHLSLLREYVSRFRDLPPFRINLHTDSSSMLLQCIFALC